MAGQIFFTSETLGRFAASLKLKDWSPCILSRHDDQGLAEANKRYYIKYAMLILCIIERFLLRAGSLQASLTAPGVCGA
jgi:hypothetical protein